MPYRANNSWITKNNIAPRANLWYANNMANRNANNIAPRANLWNANNNAVATRRRRNTRRNSRRRNTRRNNRR